MKNIISIFLLCLFSFMHYNLNAQHRKIDKLYTKATKAKNNKNWTKAIKLFDKILIKDPLFKNAILGKAGVYFNQKKWISCKDALENVIQIDPKYNPEVYFSLGLVNENLFSYREAAIAYQSYLTFENIPKRKKKKAIFKEKQCNFQHESINNPVNYKPTLLDQHINTDESEYWAVMNADNSSFVFTRRSNHQEDLYISQLKNSKFITALSLPWNTDQNEAAHCISPDGNLIIFTRCDAKDSKGGCDLYYTQFKYGKWSEPKNMGFPINSRYWDAQPSLSSNGKTLYFSSKRKDSKGKSDLFASHLNNKRWSEPKSLGPNINTTSSDESPYLHPDGQTLYFRSNGHIGMGDFDIFYSKKDPLTQKWGKAINIGYPINTLGSDGALTVAYDGKTAYYSTDFFSIKANKKPNLDIVQFELPTEARSVPVSYAKIHITDIITKKNIRASVKFYKKGVDELLYHSKTDENGMLLVSLSSNENYIININEKKYTFYSNEIRLRSDSLFANDDLKPIHLNIELYPINGIELSKKKEIILHNIFFESNSSTLQSSSMIEINNLYDYLVSLPNVHITILGHTDNIGSTSDNQLLSQKRAKAVYQRLVQKGILANRLKSNGLGDTQPIADNATKEGRRKNRRTSFLLSNKK